MSGYEMISRENIDKSTMVSYLSQFYELFRKESIKRDAGKNHCCGLVLLHHIRLSIGKTITSRISLAIYQSLIKKTYCYYNY